MLYFTKLKALLPAMIFFMAAPVFADTVLLSEDFSACDGKGTNATANITELLDNYTSVTGWTGENVYKGNGCIKLGTASKAGSITTPSLDLSDATATYVLTCKACAWEGDATTILVSVDDNDAVSVEGLNNDGYPTGGTYVDMLESFSLTISGTSSSTITFSSLQSSKGRIWLDDIVVTKYESGETIPETDEETDTEEEENEEDENEDEENEGEEEDEDEEEEEEEDDDDTTISGTGTERSPYTVADVINLNEDDGDTKVWVSGYIVGYINGSISKAVFNVDDTDNIVASNLLMADSADETDVDNCIPVQLPSGTVRTALNLSDNPNNLGKALSVYGTLETYFNVPGVKSVTDYVLESDDEEENEEEEEDEENEEEDEEEEDEDEEENTDTDEEIEETTTFTGALIAKNDGKYYAMRNATKSNKLAAREVYTPNGNTIVYTADDNVNNITWYVDFTKVTIQSKNESGKYVVLNSSSSTNISLDEDDEDGLFVYKDTLDMNIFNFYGTKRYLAYRPNYDYFGAFAESYLTNVNYIAADTMSMTLGYVRSSLTANNYGTICLPYAVKASDMSGATFYSPLGKVMDGDEAAGIVIQQVEELESGTPYIFLASDTIIVAAYSGDSATVAGTNNGLIGSFESINVDEGTYLLTSNIIKKVGTAGGVVSANRAYFDLDEMSEYTEDESAGTNTRIISLSNSGNTTGISVTNKSSDTITDVYNITGIKVRSQVPLSEATNGLQKGIYIINGKKTIVK